LAFFSFGKKPVPTGKGKEPHRQPAGRGGSAPARPKPNGNEAVAAPPNGAAQKRPAQSAHKSDNEGLISFGNLFAEDAAAAARASLSTPQPSAPKASEPRISNPASPVPVGAKPARKPRPVDRDMPQALEDCALSHANGQTSEALRCVEAAIVGGKLGPWTMQAWLIRFDLYMQLGLKAAYDAAAEQFAQLFERSPPAWSQGEPGSANGGNSGIPSVNVSGQLSAASATPLTALRKTVERYDGVQLDFARFEDADAEGCQHLLNALQAISRAGKPVRIVNADGLLSALSRHAVAGDNSSDTSTWMLKLEVLQLLGHKDEFEEVAVDYAVTYDVSPPSWQDAPIKMPADAKPIEVSTDWFQVPGDVVAPADELFAKIKAHVAHHEPVVIDLARARRMDFVSASQFVKLLAELQAMNRTIEVRFANEMVSALLVMMGAGEVAQIVPRR
jgi:ABC-type transporter Mla MlaB component